MNTSREAFEAWYDSQPDGRIQPWDVWLAAVQHAYANAEKECNRLTVALDNAGNTYHREASASQCEKAIRQLAKNAL